MLGTTQQWLATVKNNPDEREQQNRCAADAHPIDKLLIQPIIAHDAAFSAQASIYMLFVVRPISHARATAQSASGRGRTHRRQRARLRRDSAGGLWLHSRAPHRWPVRAASRSVR